MAFEQRSYAGGAVQTTIIQGINATDLTIELDSSTGWPTGGANGPFFVVINKGLSNEEKVEVQSRSGTTLTVASTGKRGVDGTSAAAHSTGSSIAHCFVAQDAAEANSHIANTSLDHHTQYLTSTRHGAVSHTQAMLGTNSVGAAQIQTGAVGADELANDAVDTAAIQDEAVTTAKIDDEAVTTGKIDDEAVTTAKIDGGAVDNSKVASGLTLVINAATDPGAVGANRWWFNTTKRSLLVRNASNNGWEVMNSGGHSVAYTPNLGGITIGNGLNYARYRHHGGTIIVDGFIKLGSTSSVTGKITVSLPVAAKDYQATYSDEFFFHAAGRASDASAGAAFGAVGVIGVGDTTNQPDRVDFFVTAGGVAWNATTPFTWTTNDRFSWFAEYEPSTLADSNFE